MQASPRILPASEEHVQSIIDLAGEIWRACYPGIISKAQIDYMLETMYAADRLREEIRRLGICYERLIVSDDFAGFASFGPHEPPHTFKLHKLYLKPVYHGRGYGTLLLRHCEREAQKLGALSLLLAVNKQNAKAIAAYQRNGFEIVDSTVTNIGRGFVMDDYVMRKSPLHGETCPGGRR